jgi:hypothetical protein
MSVLISSTPHPKLGLASLYRAPKLPDADCKELKAFPWNRPVIKQVLATLLNRPCATLAQLADLTGYSKKDVKNAVKKNPHLIFSIGRIDRKGELRKCKDLAPFIPPDELWAIVPSAAEKLREMAMVPTQMPRLREKSHMAERIAKIGGEPKRTRMSRLTTSLGVRLRIHDLIHTELTAALVRFATCILPENQKCMVLHEALLRQHFGWCHLSKERAEEIRNGTPLWERYRDCPGETWKDGNGDTIQGPPRVPMDVPDAWFVMKWSFKSTKDKEVTHKAVGVRVEVEVRGKLPKTYSHLFMQLPPQQTVIYLVPDVKLREKIRDIAKNYPQIMVPDLVIPEPGYRGRSHIDPTTFILNHAEGEDCFPLSANLYTAAQDAVFDLYRAPHARKMESQPFKKNPSREVRKSAKRRKRRARKSQRPTAKLRAKIQVTTKQRPALRPQVLDPSQEPATPPNQKTQPRLEPELSESVITPHPPVESSSTIRQHETSPVPIPEPKLEPEILPKPAPIAPAGATLPPLESATTIPTLEHSPEPSPVPTFEPKPEPQLQPEPVLPRQVSVPHSDVEPTPPPTPPEPTPAPEDPCPFVLPPRHNKSPFDDGSDEWEEEQLRLHALRKARQNPGP